MISANTTKSVNQTDQSMKKQVETKPASSGVVSSPALRHRPLVVVTAEPDRKLVKDLAIELTSDFQVVGVAVTKEQVLPISQPEVNQHLADSQWLVFTSPRAVRLFPIPACHLPPQVSVAVVGSGTAQSAKAAGWRIDLVGAGSTQALLDVFPRPEKPVLGNQEQQKQPTVLLPGSALRKATLGHGLKSLGWNVCYLDTYTMTPLSQLPALYRQADYVVVTSGSSFQAIINLFDQEQATLVKKRNCTPQTASVSRETFFSTSANLTSHRKSPKLICIGQPSAQIALAHGVKPQAIAKSPTATELAEAVRIADETGDRKDYQPSPPLTVKNTENLNHLSSLPTPQPVTSLRPADTDPPQSPPPLISLPCS